MKKQPKKKHPMKKQSMKKQPTKRHAMKRHLMPFEKVKHSIAVKVAAESSGRYGCRPEQRSAEERIRYGIVNIDKPSGPTSHQVSDYVQKILHITKAGHSGTLDPRVTGVLPVALGSATKAAQAMLNAGKEYICLMHLHDDVNESSLRDAVKQFTGKIRQLPPIKSAIKRQWREREIYYIDILETAERDVLFIVGCQAGTYIRKLCTQIGEKLGCGAHMAELRRTRAGWFDESSLCTLQDLSDAHYYYREKGDDTYIRRLIQPVEHAMLHLPKVWVLETTVDSICHGAQLSVPGIARLHDDIRKDDTAAIMSLQDEIVALGRALMDAGQMLSDSHGLAVRIERVFMQPGVYPKVGPRKEK